MNDNERKTAFFELKMRKSLILPMFRLAYQDSNLG